VVTNDAHSPLALEGDSVVELFTGPERAIAFNEDLHVELSRVGAVRLGSKREFARRPDAVPDIIERTPSGHSRMPCRLRY